MYLYNSVNDDISHTNMEERNYEKGLITKNIYYEVEITKLG
jgi:hypothetical protein